MSDSVDYSQPDQPFIPGSPTEILAWTESACGSDAENDTDAATDISALLSRRKERKAVKGTSDARQDQKEKCSDYAIVIPESPKVDSDSRGPNAPTRSATTGDSVSLPVDLREEAFLTILEKREKDRGTEFCCLVAVWLSPNDGIPQERILEYHRETKQNYRRRSLRKRQHRDTGDEDTRILKKVRMWQKTTC